MNGFGPFLCGAVVGGASVFASLSYHFVQTKQGVVTIPKISPTFTETYVDVRPFTAADWQRMMQNWVPGIAGGFEQWQKLMMAGLGAAAGKSQG